MLERGLVPDFPLQALAEFDRIHGRRREPRNRRAILGPFSGALIRTDAERGYIDFKAVIRLMNLIMAGVVALAGFNLLPIAVAALGGAALMVLIGILSPQAII
jgi:hypothetical protein